MTISHIEILEDLDILLDWQHILSKEQLVKGISNLKKKIEDKPCIKSMKLLSPKLLHDYSCDEGICGC